MDSGLQGKTVLVTAASKGLGFATARQFAAEGAHVMLASRNEASLEQATSEIRNATGNSEVDWCAADMSRHADIESLFSAVNQRFGGVDVLINNAGGPPEGMFDALTDLEWAGAFELSLMSVVRAIRLALPHMRENRWGRILNFTSSSMKQPVDNLTLSNTFRTAVAGLTKTLSIELAPDNILVNALGPGRIATDRVASLDESRAQRTGRSIAAVEREMASRIPLGRYGTPEEFASMAVFLGSAANGYVTGQSILVDGGMVRSL